MIISQYFVFFIFFSFLGWLWETVYCTIKGKHFSNRGFLFGPICPIYGCIVIAGMMIFGHINAATGEMPLWGIFLICAVGSALGEYLTSYYLEKRFHARWWDYSNMPLNLHGRICLPATLCFGFAGTVLVHFVLPVIDTVQGGLDPLIYEAAALALMGAFGADFALTEASLSTLLQTIEAVDKEFTERAEAAYEAISSTPQLMETRLISFESEMQERAEALAKELTSKQISKVGSIRLFKPGLPSHFEFKTGEHLKEAIEGIRKAQ